MVTFRLQLQETSQLNAHTIFFYPFSRSKSLFALHHSISAVFEAETKGWPSFCLVLLPFLRCICDIERHTPEEVRKKTKKLRGKLVHWDRSHLHMR